MTQLWRAAAVEMLGGCQDVAGGRIQERLAGLSGTLSVIIMSPFDLKHVFWSEKYNNNIIIIIIVFIINVVVTFV